MSGKEAKFNVKARYFKALLLPFYEHVRFYGFWHRLKRIRSQHKGVFLVDINFSACSLQLRIVINMIEMPMRIQNRGDLSCILHHPIKTALPRIDHQVALLALYDVAIRHIFAESFF